ncbi:helix-turn-helix domain-containing protein [Candidatus Sodalis pierantonius]|uniref:helix-turn-helix domain-containing protein n=1 Tax=Candidatus Sodalis pierantonii TaxID=1486991 RepID=UPI00046D96A2|nr:helix-turn-helix transcriptional regulator [Candidatus Sodalis pierantonius]
MNSFDYDQKSATNTKIRERIFTESGIIRFPERLKEAMEKAGSLSNSLLAKKSGMSEAVIRKYLKGESYPTLERLSLLANTCNCTINWLATGKESGYGDRMNKTGGVVHSCDSVTGEFLSVLSRVSQEQREELLTVIYARGIASLLSLSDDMNIKILQLPPEEKERLMRLYDQIKKGTSEVGEVASEDSLASERTNAKGPFKKL